MTGLRISASLSYPMEKSFFYTKPKENDMSRNVRNCTFWSVCTAKISVSLRIRTVRIFHECILMHSFFMRITKVDQTVRIRSLICVFIGCTCQKVRFFHVALIRCQICHHVLGMSKFWNLRSMPIKILTIAYMLRSVVTCRIWDNGMFFSSITMWKGCIFKGCVRLGVSVPPPFRPHNWDQCGA